MKNNNRGVTLFELLATISVAGIVLTLLTSILFSTLLTKNIVDYANRLDDEIYDINSFLSGRFQNIGYGSVVYYPTDNPNFQVLIVTREFEPVSSPEGIQLSRARFESKILLIDSNPNNPERNGIYYDTLFRVDLDSGISVSDQIAQYRNALDAYVTSFLTRPTGKISSDNLVIESANIEEVFCTREYDVDFLSSEFGINPDNLISNCSNAFIKINFLISYQLRSGEVLDPRTYSTTLYF